MLRSPAVSSGAGVLSLRPRGAPLSFKRHHRAWWALSPPAFAGLAAEQGPDETHVTKHRSTTPNIPGEGSGVRDTVTFKNSFVTTESRRGCRKEQVQGRGRHE